MSESQVPQPKPVLAATENSTTAKVLKVEATGESNNLKPVLFPILFTMKYSKLII